MSLLACIGLFAAVVATWIAVSGPGEAALVSAGTVAARGEDGIAPVLVIAFLGTFAGSLAAYWLGRAGGRRLLLWPGPLLAWRTRLLLRSEGLMQRRAFLASYFGPGWLAGINELPARPFIAGSALSGLMWTLTIGLGAFFVGPSLVSLYDDISGWATLAALAVAVAAAILVLTRRATTSRFSPSLFPPHTRGKQRRARDERRERST
jgi:membrane protein DedA with SNARE-associated domain